MVEVMIIQGEAHEAVIKALRKLGYKGDLSVANLTIGEEADPKSVAKRAAEALERAYERGDHEDGLHRFVVQSVERPLIEDALARTGGNQVAAARLLGINRNTLRDKIRRLGIEIPRPPAFL
jgi:two-component system nitrogen regulation response regulator GlnG